nr:hypothetical protein GCM10020093_045230 [Planobispora longispora]
MTPDDTGQSSPVLGALQALLVFGVIWWMYAGYAWLTNAIPRCGPPGGC